MRIGGAVRVHGIGEGRRAIEEADERRRKRRGARRCRYVLRALLLQHLLQTGIIEGPERAFMRLEQAIYVGDGGLHSGVGIERILGHYRAELGAEGPSAAI